MQLTIIKYKTFKKKGIEDYIFWLFRILLIAGVVLWIAVLKNNLISESYNLHSAEQAMLSNLIGNSKNGMLLGSSASNGLFNQFNLAGRDTLTEEYISHMIDLEKRQIAFKVEVFDLNGALVYGPFYSNKEKFEVYAPLNFSKKFAVT